MTELGLSTCLLKALDQDLVLFLDDDLPRKSNHSESPSSLRGMTLQKGRKRYEVAVMDGWMAGWTLAGRQVRESICFPTRGRCDTQGTLRWPGKDLAIYSPGEDVFAKSLLFSDMSLWVPDKSQDTASRGWRIQGMSKSDGKAGRPTSPRKEGFSMTLEEHHFSRWHLEVLGTDRNKKPTVCSECTYSWLPLNAQENHLKPHQKVYSGGSLVEGKADRPTQQSLLISYPRGWFSNTESRNVKLDWTLQSIKLL